MAKSKEVKSAPKKAKTEEKSTKKNAKAASSKPKATGLSEERVVDSESDEEPPVVKEEAAKSQKPVKDTRKKKEPKKKLAAAPPPPKKEPAPSSDDDDSEEESGSDESDSDEEMLDAPVLKKPDSVPGKVNGVKRKAASASSLDDGESSDEATSDEDAKPDPKRVKTALKDAGEVEQVGEAASDEEDEDSEHDEEKDTREEPSAKKAPAPSRTQHSGNLHSIPVQPFKPPNGHSSVEFTDATFSAQSFSGQQIWHIVAPTSVPLRSISDVALEAIQTGATVLTHKGTDYTLSEDTNPNNRFDSVIVPSSSSYNVVQQPIAKTLYLKQKVFLPNLSKRQADMNTGSSAAADVAQPSISEVRPQPKGIRMRYKPAGFGSGDPGLGSDSEEEDTQAKTNGTKFQFPKALGVYGTTVEAENAETPNTKKSNKKRRGSDVEMVNGNTVKPSPASAPKITSSADVDRGTSIAGTSASKDELSKEEKKRRKAEKKAKKEAKAGKVTVAA